MKRQQIFVHGDAFCGRQLPRVMPENPRAAAQFGKRLIQLLLIHALLIVPLAAQDASPKLTGWKWSVAALVAANAVDAASNWGRPELNPVIGPRFAWRGIAIKGAGTVALALVEHRLERPPRRFSTALNFVAAGALTVIAARNAAIRKGGEDAR